MSQTEMYQNSVNDLRWRFTKIFNGFVTLMAPSQIFEIRLCQKISSNENVYLQPVLVLTSKSLSFRSRFVASANKWTFSFPNIFAT